MYYSHENILGIAVPLGDGWKKAVIVLKDGDTAHSALSTKYDFAGPGTVTYLIHASGWTVRTSSSITRSYI